MSRWFLFACPRGWTWLLAVFAIALSACGGGGGSGGGTGSLSIAVSGLPAGASAIITVTAANGYARTIDAATTLVDVPAGVANIAASNVVAGGTVYAATLSAASVTITAGASSSVTVSYSALPGALPTGSIALTVSGLPAGAAAAVTVSGQYGYTRSATGSITFGDVPVGAATVSAGQVVGAGTTYAATVTGSPLTVAAGATHAVGVAYAAIAPAAKLTVSGTARFESVPTKADGSLNYAAIVSRPIRGAVVEIRASPSQALLATTETTDTGQYSAEIDAATTSFFVRVKAHLSHAGTPAWSFVVADNTNSEATWVLDTAPQNPNGANVVVDPLAGSGWTGSGYGQVRASGPFAILDAVYEAHRKTLTVAPVQAWPTLRLLWSPSNRAVTGVESPDPATGLITTTLYNGLGVDGIHRIYILGQENVDTDEFDRHVVTHEFGHYIQAVISRDDSVGGAHGLTDRLDMRVAFSEGWGNGWSGIALDDPKYTDSSGLNQASGGWFDVSLPDTVVPGWFKEDTMQYVVWQLNQQLGLAPIWQALAGPMRTSIAFGGAHLFSTALKQVAPSSGATVDALYGSHAIIANDEFATGETNSGGNADALPIYKALSAPGSATLCVNKNNGIPNKVGNTAFAKLVIPTTRSYTITLTGGEDPDFELRNATTTVTADSSVPASETLTQTLQAGTYTLWAYDWVMLYGLSNFARQCLTLSVN